MATKQKLPCDELPEAGDVFVCADDCGMTVTILKDCNCGDVESVSLICCSKSMKKVN